MHHKCRDLSRDYLQCRMDAKLMSEENLDNVSTTTKKFVFVPISDVVPLTIIDVLSLKNKNHDIVGIFRRQESYWSSRVRQGKRKGGLCGWEAHSKKGKMVVSTIQKRLEGIRIIINNNNNVIIIII